MAITPTDWAQLLADIEANFEVITPTNLDAALAGDIANIGQAKVYIVEILRVVSAMLLKDSLSREEQTQKNLITNRIATAKSGYETDHPGFDPNTWPDYSNAEMFAMIQPYDPLGGLPLDIEDTFFYVYTTLNGKVRDATDKINNLFKKIMDVEPLF